MSGEESQEKTEQPTERRLKQAIEQGQVLTSRDFVMASVLLAGALQLHFLGRFYYEEFADLFRRGLDVAGPLASELPLTRMLGERFGWALALILLFSAPLLLTAIGAQSLLGGGFHFIWGNLAVKGNRLSPAAGLARMFGAQAALELLKSILKIVAVGVVGALFLRERVPQVLALPFAPLDNAIDGAGSLILLTLLILVGATAFLGAADAAIQWRRRRGQLMMSRQEMKEEHKESEGSPEVKQRIRRLQQEMAQRGSVAQVDKAQVVIVNPTRFAVALHYDFEEGAAPKVLAKGTEQVALSIREKADELGIPVLTIPLLARALYYTSEIGAEIHADLYRAVATVLSFVFQAGAQGEAPEVEIPEALRFDANGRRLGGAA